VIRITFKRLKQKFYLENGRQERTCLFWWDVIAEDDGAPARAALPSIAYPGLAARSRRVRSGLDHWLFSQPRISVIPLASAAVDRRSMDLLQTDFPSLRTPVLVIRRRCREIRISGISLRGCRCCANHRKVSTPGKYQ